MRVCVGVRHGQDSAQGLAERGTITVEGKLRKYSLLLAFGYWRMWEGFSEDIEQKSARKDFRLRGNSYGSVLRVCSFEGCDWLEKEK